MPHSMPRPMHLIFISLEIVMAIAVVWRIIPDGPGVPWQLQPEAGLQTAVKLIYYAVPPILLLSAITVRFRNPIAGSFTMRPVSAACLVLLTAAIVSLSVNHVADIFQSRPRLISFGVLMALAGPVFFSRNLHIIRKNLLQYICAGCIIVSLLYAIALLFYLTHYTSYLSRFYFIWDWLNVASVPCGMAAAFGTLFAWTRLCGSPRIKWIWIAALTICWWTLVMASSRAAIAGIAAALTAILFLPGLQRSESVPSWLRYVTIGMIAFMAVAVFRPLTEIMETKYWKIADTVDNDFFSSRRNIWDTRSQEAENHWLFGMGYATVESNPGTLNPTGSVPSDGRIEPGSGWLYLLSSCGIFALISFAIIYIIGLTGAVRNLLRPRNTAACSPPLILGLLLLFGIHLCSEGYVVAAGSPFCVILWLTLGIACTPHGKSCAYE